MNFGENNIIKYTKFDKLKNLGLTSLDEVLSIETNKIILLEIKDFNLDVDNFINIIDKYNKDIYIMSFSKEVMKKIIEHNKKYKCGILNYIFNSENNYDKYDFIALLNNTITNDIIRYFGKRNIKIFSYGILDLKNFNSNIYYIVDNNAKFMIK